MISTRERPLEFWNTGSDARLGSQRTDLAPWAFWVQHIAQHKQFRRDPAKKIPFSRARNMSIGSWCMWEDYWLPRSYLPASPLWPAIHPWSSHHGSSSCNRQRRLFQPPPVAVLWHTRVLSACPAPWLPRNGANLWDSAHYRKHEHGHWSVQG